ncbi:MAG: NAD(P)-dependent oxidoreductase [Albidovulum sp.]|nr:NAD(P)-dependent oxidoreductase [Albidovulum sp.]
MKRIGVVGLGDMGSGMAKNLIRAGYETAGFDLMEPRMKALEDMGGLRANSPAEVAMGSSAVFVMVLNGNQAKSVILGQDGLCSKLEPGSAVVVTATIKPVEVREIAASMEGTGIHLIDSPVSGGSAGAQGGTLTMMTSAPDEVFEEFRTVLEAVGESIHHVGKDPGIGQTVKACLQSLIGSHFTAAFESTVLAAKAGVDADVIYNVFSTSGVGCPIGNYAIKNIINGQFEGTGSHINTMHKDLTISLDLARELGVPLFTASTAMQLFEAGKTKYPSGDNWTVTRISEDIVGSKLRRGK